jgi:hypothetical protein
VDGGLQFDWDVQNVGHLARHNVRPEEAEQALSGENRGPGLSRHRAWARALGAFLSSSGLHTMTARTVQLPLIRLLRVLNPSTSVSSEEAGLSESSETNDKQEAYPQVHH